MENSPITENDTKPEFQHYTVMLNEAVDALIPDGAVSDKIFVDATLGGGGHSALLILMQLMLQRKNLSLTKM